MASVETPRNRGVAVTTCVPKCFTDTEPFDVGRALCVWTRMCVPMSARGGYPGESNASRPLALIL